MSRYSGLIKRIIYDLALCDLGWKYQNTKGKWTYVGENKDKIPAYAKGSAVKTRDKKSKPEDINSNTTKKVSVSSNTFRSFIPNGAITLLKDIKGGAIKSGLDMKFYTYPESDVNFLHKGGFINIDKKDMSLSVTDKGEEVLSSKKPNIRIVNRDEFEQRLMILPIRSRKITSNQKEMLTNVKDGSPFNSDDEEFRQLEDAGLINLKTRSNTWEITPLGKKTLKVGSIPVTMSTSSIQDKLGHTNKGSQQEKWDMQKYKGLVFHDINTAIVTGEPSRLDSEIANIDQVIDQCTLIEPCTLYHGPSKAVSHLLVDGHKKGDEFQMDVFTSTSLDPKVITPFTNLIKRDDGTYCRVTMKISQEANSHCYYYGDGDKEKEVLLPRKTLLKIKDMKTTMSEEMVAEPIGRDGGQPVPTKQTVSNILVICDRI